MNDEPENPWKQLVDAARESPPAQDPVPPPPRVSDIRRRVMALVHALLWRRVSLWLALVAGLAWLVISLLPKCQHSPPTLIPPPPDPIQIPKAP